MPSPTKRNLFRISLLAPKKEKKNEKLKGLKAKLVKMISRKPTHLCRCTLVFLEKIQATI